MEQHLLSFLVKIAYFYSCFLVPLCDVYVGSSNEDVSFVILMGVNGD